MARKRASLKDKGEEILGIQRGGQGADILFGSGTKAEAAAKPEGDESAAADASSTQEGPPAGKAGRDKSPSAKAAADGVTASRAGEAAPAVAEQPAAMEGLPQGEADLDEESDLDRFLSAEAQAAAGEATLPDLATTPAALAPPVSGPATLPPSPPTVERPLPAPPPSPPPASPQGGPASTPPPVIERPKPSPPPQTPVYPLEGAAGTPPPVAAAAPSPPPTPAVAPPSTASGAPDLSVPRPPRYIQMVGKDFDLSAGEPSADAAAAAQVGAPEGLQLTPEQQAELLRRRSVQEKLANLDKAIDGQYKRILQDNVSVNKPITDWCQNMLAEANEIVLNREVGKLAKAEWNVEQVRARLDRAVESQKLTKRWVLPIIFWGLAWFVAFVYLIFNPAPIVQLLNATNMSDALLSPEIFLQALFFGGIGGVSAVFYHLFKYTRERTFDSQFVASYFGKPIMGMILGSIIYLTLFGARFVGLAVFGAQTGGSDVTGLRYIVYVTAIATGFKENLAFDLLNRTIKTVLGSEEEEEAPAPSASPPATTPTNP
jgi:hypothetical protein